MQDYDEKGLLEIYYKDLHHSILSESEVQELIAKCKSEEGCEARHKLIIHHTRLVVSVAKRYQWTRISLLDLIQAGNCGLVKCIGRYESTGSRFFDFAKMWIRKSIREHVYEAAKIVRPPADSFSNVQKYRKAQEKLTQEFSRAPSVFEISAELEWTLKKTKRVMRTMLRETLSLSEPIQQSDKTYSLADLKAKTPLLLAEKSEGRSNEQHLRDFIDKVEKVSQGCHKQRNFVIFIKSYGLDGNCVARNFGEVGAEFGVSDAGVSALVNKMWKKLEEKYGYCKIQRWNRRT